MKKKMSRMSKKSRQITRKNEVPAQITLLHAEFKSRVHKYIVSTYQASSHRFHNENLHFSFSN